MGCDIIVIDVHVGFQEKLCFWRMGCDIFIVDEWNCCLYLTCVVWRPEECESQAWKKYVYVEYDLLLMLLLMTLIDMWWCWYLWWYWFELTLLMKSCQHELMLLLMIMWIWNEVVVVVDSVIEIRWCLCWEQYWNGMLMMLEMPWDVHVVYSWGVQWPCRMSLLWETRVAKEFKHFWGDS